MKVYSFYGGRVLNVLLINSSRKNLNVLSIIVIDNGFQHDFHFSLIARLVINGIVLKVFVKKIFGNIPVSYTHLTLPTIYSV